MFGERIDVARGFTDNLADQGELRGLIGPLELPRLWSRHVLNSALLAPLMQGSVADIGSGGGLPGLVLAIARPDVHFTLVEPMERRTDWLSEQVQSLGLENVDVRRARAEDLGVSRSFDVVTARAVGALSKLIPITAPLVRPGGELVLLKGAAVDQEVAKAAKVISRHRLSDPRVEVLGDGTPIESTRVFRARVD
ncbi:16S rRNA (guanine(527)-N(7))-methyltransferase RsmG [Herbiconiux sp. L3-i23]|uniref:16S rRNA (guanine(527)-N(7))-methyltransferase RsmG n=1 Tax=Herbiconiux sp. L3-i23 TaxID=2905871 RepID=UPI00207402B2|nr:16S rRNA (guanine(527)-N(7))-methyltransferase RsmG [Herbiconiux sp. L3-i23]